MALALVIAFIIFASCCNNQHMHFGDHFQSNIITRHIFFVVDKVIFPIYGDMAILTMPFAVVSVIRIYLLGSMILSFYILISPFHCFSIF